MPLCGICPWRLPLAGGSRNDGGLGARGTNVALHRVHYNRLDDIANLEVVEVLAGHSTLLSGDHLFDVLLDMLQRIDLAVKDLAALAPHAKRGSLNQLAGLHQAAGNGAGLGAVERGANLGLAREAFL